MKVFIGGSRRWLAQAPIEQLLRTFPPGTIIIEGDAPGVDRIAGYVGELLGFEVRRYPALANGRQWPWAGPVRNQEMIDKEHPSADGLYIERAYLFHQDPSLGKGTRDMRVRLEKAYPPIPIEVFIGRGR